MDETREVIKASAAIQIENTISLLARRTWTVLLYNAYDELPYTNKHTIRVKTLKEILEYDSKNDDYLKETLRTLNKCEVHWNVLDRDNEWEWGSTTLLAGVTIKRGICTYGFGPILSERLHNPRLYARISLSLQNKFESKHALALWEVCLDYLNHMRNYGETPFLPLDTFRQLMGIAPDQYVSFKLLNLKVIKDPIAEINDKTDFDIKIEYRRKSRKVDAVKFRFRRVSPIFDQQVQQPTLFDGDTDIPPLVKELRHVGVPLDTAWDIWQNAFDQVASDKRPSGVDFDTYVRGKIALMQQKRPEKVRNAAGFIIEAIRENWDETRPRSTPRRTVERQATPVDDATTEDPHAACRALIEQFPALLDQLLNADALKDEQPFLLKQYSTDLRTKSLLWNYEHHPALAAYAEAKLLEVQKKAAS